ncbi:MAG: hypothetical protein ACYS32_11560 [Planctomycetota bacterium]|jgi:hypothetical protein
MSGKANLKTYVAITVFLLGAGFLCGCDEGGPSEAEVNQQGFKKLPYTFDFSIPSGPYQNRSAVGFDGPFPEMPSEMMVYKVVHPNNINEAYVRELAQKHFDMPPDAKFETTTISYRLKTSMHRFRFDPKTGSFNIRKIDQIDTHSTTKNDYPSNQDCNSIAVKYLKRCKLYEADAYFRGIVDNTKGSGVMSLGFGRKIAGYKNRGNGGEMSVGIGPGGEVVYVRKAWQELVPYKPYPIKTARQALKDLYNHKGFLTGIKGKIKKITLRYHTSGNKQDYVQPIYYFECSGPEMDFYGAVPTIKKGYIQSREEHWKEIREERSRRSE